MIKNFLSRAHVALVLTCIWSGLNAAEISYSLTNEEDKVFKYTNKYPFWEQRYDPPVSLEVLTDKYDETQYINPYPEELTTFILNAMKAGDYERWLGYWTPFSQKVLSNEDNTSDLVEKRKKRWNELFSRGRDVYLTTLVHVGEAQYTYLMAISKVVEKEAPHNVSAILYFPLMTGGDGKWYAAQELLKHPVLKRYVESDSAYYLKNN